MKKIYVLFVLLGIILVFSSCNKENTEIPDVSESASGTSMSEEEGGTAAAGNTAALADNSIHIQGDVVEAAAYNLEIPDGFEVKSSEDSLLLENKKGTIQFNIMDKTDVASDFESYVQKTYDSAVASGMAEGEIEDAVIKNRSMKRFAMSMTQDGEQLDSYVYFARVNSRVIMITLTSKDGGLEDASAADAFVAQIDF